MPAAKKDTTAKNKRDITILVVDDEANIRGLVKKQLKSIGCKAMTAVDGIQAVKIYKKHRDEIDMVLLDIIMPNMSGKGTLIELKRINPDIKIVLFSGYDRNGRAKELINQGVKGFIQKPFRLFTLAKVISEVLLR